MHAAPEQQACLHFAFQSVADRLFRGFQQLDDVLHVPPEVGGDRHVEGFVAVGGYGEPRTGLTLGELHVVEFHLVAQAADGEAEVVRVVDAEAEQELLFKQLGLHHVNLDQLDLRVLEVAEHPAAAGKQPKDPHKADNSYDSRLIVHVHPPRRPSVSTTCPTASGC
ncbi:hypothetical protein D3C80_1570990 [compost metagenome]